MDIHVQPGTRLADLVDQDSYSFELGFVFVGADDPKTLVERIRECDERLSFRLAPVSGN